MSPNPWRCSSAIDVTMAMSGSTMPRRVAISPGMLVPNSITATSASAGSDKRVSGTPMRLFRFPVVAWTRSRDSSAARSKSFVLVFPLLPATAMRVPPHTTRRNLASDPSATSVSWTRKIATSSAETSTSRLTTRARALQDRDPRSCHSTCTPQQLCHNLTLVEWTLFCADNLISLVPLPCEQYRVARRRDLDCACNRSATIAQSLVWRLHPPLYLVDDRLRIFRTRIVTRDDDAIGPSLCGCAHEWSLAGIAIAARSEYEYDFASNEWPNRCKAPDKRVRRVSVVANNRRRMGDEFEPSRYLRNDRKRVRQSTQRNPNRQRSGNRGQ